MIKKLLHKLFGGKYFYYVPKKVTFSIGSGFRSYITCKKYHRASVIPHDLSFYLEESNDPTFAKYNICKEIKE